MILDAVYYSNIVMIPIGKGLLNLTADINASQNAIFWTLQVEHVIVWLLPAISLFLYLTAD